MASASGGSSEHRPSGARTVEDLTAKLGLGLAAVGRPAYINLGREADLGPDRSVGAMRDRAHALLDRAYEAGIRYFDVARSYGRAEDFLASWLERRGLRPGEVTVASKWGYAYTGGWLLDAEKHEVKDHSLATLERQLAETRELLGEHLSLYQVHSATLGSGVLGDAAVLERLAGLRDDGVAVGLTLSGPGQADTLRHALAAGGPFEAVQATWNPLEPSAAGALAEAAAAGWRVIVKEGLANGRLAGRGHDGFAALARERGNPPDALALAAALAQPWAGVVLSGAATVEQLDSNLAAPAVDAGELPDLAEPAERYWEKRSALSWD